MTQLRLMFAAPGAQGPFVWGPTEAGREGRGPAVPDVGEVLPQVPEGGCGLQPHLVNLIPTLGSDPQSAQSRASSSSLLSCPPPGEQSTLSARG